jgi:ABC-2 type transport system ATP-binding protein
VSIIEVHELRRRYGGYEAVRGVSFAVERGELFALLGTNGAGKTSTMEVVEGLSRPTAGHVRVHGLDPYTDRRTVRPLLGIMLQDGGFPADLTVREMARTWAGTLTRPRPVAETLELVGLASRAGVAIKQLSGGERRRLDLALAIAGRPDVLFLDEPTTGLDPEGRRNTWRLIRSLLVDGTTVVLTTHYLEEAEELADRLAILHAGTIVAAGTVAEVVASHPARISFTLADDALVRGLPALSGTRSVHSEHRAVTVRTDALQRTLAELLAWANPAGIELRGLQARSASLDEAFLAVADADVAGNKDQEGVRA